MKIIATIATALMLLGVSACETTSRSAVTLMSDADYLRATPEQRQADDAAVAGLGQLEARREAMFKAYLPVNYGDDRTGYTIQCIRQPGPYNAVATYPGHNPPGMDGAVHEGMLVLVADKNCNVLYQEGPKGPDGQPGVVSPVKLLANVATQEDMSRRMWSSVAPAILNGTGAALIAGATNCDANCGMSLVVNGGTALAAANSEANSGANVQVGVSGACGATACQGIPRD